MTSHISSGRPRRGAVLCGAYGLGNAGDEAILTAIVAQLRRIDAELPITVITRRPGATARRLEVSAVHPLRFTAWLAAMGRAKLFISGGGSLLQDVTSRRSLWFYLTTIRLAKRRGCAVQLYGCGIGPLSEAGQRKTARVLNDCVDAATLRDEDSAALLRAMGVDRPHILLAADPVLTLPAAPGERERSAGFLLRDWPGLRERLPALAACARYVYEKYRLTPVFIAMADGDREPARAVCAALQEAGVPCSVSVDVRRVSRMGLVVSMRLHGLILALNGGVPAAGLSYDPKVDAFCREAGLPCLPLAEAEEDSLTSLADAAAHLDAEKLSSAAAALRQRELANSRMAAQLLEQ